MEGPGSGRHSIKPLDECTRWLKFKGFPVKSFSLLTLLLTVAIAALVANTFRMSNDLVRSRRNHVRDILKVQRLQVQLMDRVLATQKGKQLDLLLGNPTEWVAPLKAMINNDIELSKLLRDVAFVSPEMEERNEYNIYCNPVDDDSGPTEVFTLVFSGDKCIDIRTRALYLW